MLELTESVLLASGETSTQRLAALKESGIKLALDDFGTGYASLSYLQRFPVDIVKIDRSFTDSIDTGTADLVLLKGIVDLGNALGTQPRRRGNPDDGSARDRPRPRVPGCARLLLRPPCRRRAPQTRRPPAVIRGPTPA